MRDVGAVRVAIRLLGPVEVRVGGAPLEVDTRKAIALLAYLAVTGRPTSRETLAALLWPEADEAAARGALRRTLSVLNAALGGAALAIDRSSVVLRDEAVDVDLRRFQAALSRARGHGHGPDEPCPPCLAALDEAAALDRGEFMAGFALRDSEAFDEWQLAEAEAHRRELAGALERLARGREAARAWEAALAAGRRWLDVDPLHEPAHRLMMNVLARAGEPAAAIHQYRECVRILAAELGVAPLTETTALYEEIRAGTLAPGSGSQTAAEVQAVVPAPGAPAIAARLQLVGRDAELAALLAAHRAIGPDGRLLVIEGEPGIGKTRLAAVYAGEVRAAGGEVLEARAYAGEGAIAFAPIASLIRAGLERPGAEERLRSLRPDVRQAAVRLVPLPGSAAEPRRATGPDAAAMPDAYGRARVVEGLTEVLTALVQGPVPGVIVLDDLDWADASSVEVVAYLAHRLRGRPVAVLATWRSLDGIDEDLRRLLSSAERDGFGVRVVLERLGRSAVAGLANAVLGAAATDSLVDALFAESEGLPLYVAEALASSPADVGTIPGGVLALLRARLASVGEVAAQVLAAGAVIGRSFDFETVRLASGRSEEETIGGLEELVRRGLVREVGLSHGDVWFDFTHGRLRDVAYESLGLVRRRLLHRRVAGALAAPAGADNQAGIEWARIAYHETLAGRSGEAAEAHRQAARHDREIFANREAREHLEAALALGHPASAELHEVLGEVLTLLGDYAGAIAHLEAAAAAGPPERGSAIERALALVHARLGDWSLAASHVAAAIEAAPDDPIVRSALLADRSAIARRLGDGAGAEVLAREALGLAEAADDRASIARACQVMGALARQRGELGAARILLERAIEASNDAADPGLRIAALNTLALVLASTGDGERSLAVTREALERCERQGDRHRQAALENNLADLLRAAGRREEAMDHLKRAVAIFAEISGRPGVLEPEIWKLVEW